MKIRTRIATAVTVAIASLFVATPAFAHAEETVNFDKSGGSFDYVAIAILMAILLIIVFAVSTGLGNLFNKKN